MVEDPIDVASTHLDRLLKRTAGHRFLADPHVQATAGGDAVVRFSRQYRGIPLFLQNIAVHVNPHGEAAQFGGSTAGVGWRSDVVPELSAAAAVQHAMNHFRGRLRKSGRPCRVGHRAYLARRSTGARAVASFPLPSRPAVFITRRGAAAVHLVFVIEDQGPQLCWLVRLPTGGGGEYLIVVAAANERAGTIVFCAPWSASARCTASVFRSAPDVNGSNRQTVVLPQPISAYPAALGASPNAQLFADWMSDASMISNSVQMFLDNDEAFLTATSTSGGLQLATADDPFGADQALVNAFFVCNYLHDFFLLLGFGEAEGNFQLVNSTKTGTANDRLQVLVFDSVLDKLGIMKARDDGTAPELRLGRSPAGRLAALDSDIVIHEYGHGVSHRLVGGRLGFDSLMEEQSIAVDEGWSDYFAITIQNAFRPGAEVFTFGSWVSGNPNGLRLAPYDEHYPGTYASLGKKPYDTPIAAAEVWAHSLIRINDAIGNDVHSTMRGHEIGWSAVVESMKLVDDKPTFVQARDAVFAAFEPLRKKGVIDESERDVAISTAQRVFRDHGLGANASSDGKRLRDARAGVS